MVDVGELKAARESFKRVVDHLASADKQHGIFDPENHLEADLARLEKVIDQIEAIERREK